MPNADSLRASRLAFALALLAAATGLDARAPGCPKWEAGARYPWQSNQLHRGDLYAWLALDVDRSGYPVRCRVAANNYPDAESRVWLCKQYYERWRGPAADKSAPAMRTLERFSLVPGPAHQALDWKARPKWFAAHPTEQPKCYPEPSRPDRMDL